MPELTLSRLIRESPLKAGGRFAAVNRFIPEFNPRNPINFRQLAHLQIAKGSPFICLILDTLVEPIGTIMEGTKTIAITSEGNWITALIQTSLKEFPTAVEFEYKDHMQLIIRIDYIKQIWCSKCFSFDHTSSICRNQEKTQVIWKQRTSGHDRPDRGTGLSPRGQIYKSAKPHPWRPSTGRIQDSSLQHKCHKGVWKRLKARYTLNTKAIQLI
jgi:hypothetical protein